jgi:hypothetical protein
MKKSYRGSWISIFDKKVVYVTRNSRKNIYFDYDGKHFQMPIIGFIRQFEKVVDLPIFEIKKR